MFSLKPFLPFLLLLALPTAAPAGQASGRFTAQGGDFGGVITPTHAAAYVVREPYHARRKVVEVVLSGAPMDPVAASAALHPHTHAINQDALMRGDYVLLWVATDGRVSMNATFGQTMTQFLAETGGSMQAELAVNTPERVAGRVFTTQPLRTMAGGAYAFDLGFDTAVTRLPAGIALPKGGGAPGKAFAAFMAAAGKKQWAAIKSASSPEALKAFEADYRTPKENAEYALDLLRVWLPKSRLKVIGGEQRDDTADLEIEGDMFPGTPALYLARMRREDGKWLFVGAAMQGMLP